MKKYLSLVWRGLHSIGHLQEVRQIKEIVREQESVQKIATARNAELPMLSELDSRKQLDEKQDTKRVCHHSRV